MKSKTINIKIATAIIAATLLAVTGCKKIEDQFPSKTVTVTYPGITLKGGEGITINVGDAYTDPGATLTDDITGAQSDVEAVDNPVDVNTPGLYMVTYQAGNANGFVTTVQRPVLVSNISDSWDLTGDYARTSNGVINPVTKIGRGLYRLDNVGGVPPPSAFIFSVYMGQLDETTLDVPAQIIADGTVMDCLNETLVIAPPDTSFSYVVDNISFGTATRTFVKQ